MIYTEKAFWLDALERAIKSAGQGAVLGWGAGTFTAVAEVATAAEAVGYAAFGMFVLSLLTSIGSARIGATEGPSLVGAGLPVVAKPAPAEVEPSMPLPGPDGITEAVED